MFKNLKAEELHTIITAISLQETHRLYKAAATRTRIDDKQNKKSRIIWIYDSMTITGDTWFIYNANSSLIKPKQFKP